MPPTFLLLFIITNEKTVILMQCRSIGCYSPPRLNLQKHIPITLIGIPYLINQVSYTLDTPARLACALNVTDHINMVFRKFVTA